MADFNPTTARRRTTRRTACDQIDAVDQQMLTLLNQRARLAQAVGEVKGSMARLCSAPTAKPRSLTDSSNATLAQRPAADSIAPIWREIMSACRSLETPSKGGLPGPIGTFTEQAAINYFGSSIDALACPQHRRSFPSHLANLPISGSSHRKLDRRRGGALFGPVVARRCSSWAKPACWSPHNLLRKVPNPKGSPPWWPPPGPGPVPRLVDQNLPDAERRPYPAMPKASPGQPGSQHRRHCQRTRGFQYGVHVVSPAIQTTRTIATRFVIITTPDKPSRAQAPTGHDCTSVVVSVDNRPGAVHDMLVPLKRQMWGPMSRLESRPARSGQWEYLFFIDLAGHPDQDNPGSCLGRTASAMFVFKVLGSYPLGCPLICP